MHIVSIGAGGCFQELILHAQLTNKEGYKVNWTIVDKECQAQTVKDFQFFAKILEPTTYVTHIAEMGEEYLEKFVEGSEESSLVHLEKLIALPDVVLAIDLGSEPSMQIRECIKKIQDFAPKLIYAEMDKNPLKKDRGFIEIQIS